MADQKQPFRFRHPWLAPERPAAQPQRRRPITESPQVPWRPSQSASRSSSSTGATQNPKTFLYSAISEPSSSTSSTTAKSSPSSQAATETIKANSKPTTSSTSSTITKPPSPSSMVTEIPKAKSQSTPSPLGSTIKISSPSRTTTESLKSTSQSTPQSPSKQPRAATESSTSRAAIESPKSTISPSSKQPTTTSVAVSRAVNESPKATSKSVSAQSSPSRAIVESRSSSQPASPSTQARTLSKVTSTSSSPSKGDSKSKNSSMPPSPSRSTSQAQPEARKRSQPQSPSHLEPPKITPSKGSPSRKATQKELEATASYVSQSLSSAPAQQYDAQEEPKKETYQDLTSGTNEEPKEDQKEPEATASNVEVTSGTTKSPALQDDSITKKRPDALSSEKSMPASKEVVAEPKKPQIVDSEVGRDDQKPMVGESKETEGMKEKVQELPKEEKNQQATTCEEQVKKAIIKIPSLEKDGRDIHVGEFQASKRQQKQEDSTRKETSTTTSYIGKHIKTIEGTSMSFQNTVEEATTRQREIKEDISKLVQKLATGTQSDENQVTVITLIGENRGASMLLSSEQLKKEAPIHIHRGYKTDPDDIPDTTTDEEVRDNTKKLDSQMAPEPKAYVNSNAQGVNNSIVVEASLAERNPGVHLFLSQNTSKAIKASGASEFIQTSRAECSATTSARLTHEPSVRRRCLRGLFMESSDSDLDNPNKPRRHGCRYSCRKNKDQDFM